MFPDYTDVKIDKLRLEHFSSLHHVLQDYFGTEYLPNSAELLGMYGKVSCEVL